MAIRHFRLDDEQAAELQSAFLQEKHGPTRTRFQAVRRYGLGYQLEEVIAIMAAHAEPLRLVPPLPG